MLLSVPQKSWMFLCVRMLVSALSQGSDLEAWTPGVALAVALD